MGKKLAFITAAVLTLLSCENPIQAGLGGKVDITVPVINMVSPRNVGDHVKGEFTLEINAKDDIGVTKVQVAVTVDGEGNPLPETAWEWKPAELDKVSGLWTYPVDTTQYADGDLPVRIKAEDATGKSVIFEGMYVSKNNPPQIDLQIPAMIDDPTPERHMELVTGGVMIGVAKDLWGVAPGYPKIQFWPVSEGENPLNPSWQLMDTYAARPATEWAAATSGKTALEFQYHGVDRTDTSRSLEDMPGLLPGSYRFRFQIKDVDETSAVVTYPASGSYELEVIAAKELPLAEITARDGNGNPLEGQYYREPFYLDARVSHTTGIYEAYIEVRKEGEEGSVKLARRVYSENIVTGSGPSVTRFRNLQTFLIEPGQRYIHTDMDPNGNIAPNDYRFTDGTYTFTVYATSVQTSYARQPLTVYIDTTAPEIAITRVQPNVEAQNPGPGPDFLDTYTVNGFIAADMSSYDVNNIGVFVPDPDVPGVSYREIKYLIKDDYDSAADPRALYDDAAAQYFDNPAAPVYKRPNSTSSVIIDTTHSSMVPGPRPDPAYYTARNKYLHLIARDRAGNYSFTAALLKVDQSTDLPQVTITSFNDGYQSQRSPALLDVATNPNTLDTGRVMAGTFTDDDGVLVGDVPGNNISFTIYKEDLPVIPPYTPPSLSVPDNLIVLNDGRTVTFRVPLPTDDTMPDGVYSVEIVIKDNVAKKNELKPGSLTDLPLESFNTTNGAGRIFFVLDTEPPVIKETKIGDTDNAPYLTASLFNLEGTVSDVNGLRTLRILQIEDGLPNKTVFGPVSYTAPNNKDEPWTVPAGTLPWALVDGDPPTPRTGDFTYKIIAEDKAGRTTELTRRVTMDLIPPVLEILQPLQGSWIKESLVVIKGKETDNYRPGPVFYHIAPAPSMGAIPPVMWLTSLADYETDVGWTKLTFPGEDWTATIDSLGEGFFFLYVAAFDEAGNQDLHTNSIRTFGVDYTVPYMKDWTAPKVIDRGGFYYAKDPYTLSFNAYDSNALYIGGSPASVQVKAAIGGSPAIDLIADGSSHPELGGYILTIDDSDPAIRTWPVELELTNPPDGNISFEFIITDAGGSQNTLNNTPGVDADAHRRITIKTDRQGPNLAVSAPAAGSAIVAGNSLQTSGAATDLGIPEDVLVYYTVADAEDSVTAPATSADAEADSAWTKALPDASWYMAIPIGLGTSEGEKLIHFAAYDQLDNRTLASRMFYVDNKAPQINAWTSARVTQRPFDVPSANLLNVGSYDFGFTAHDTHGIKRALITRNGNILYASDVLPDQSGIPQTDPVQGNYTVTVTKTDIQNWTVTASFTGQAPVDFVYGIEIEDIAGRINPPDNSNGDPGTANGIAANAFKTFNVTVDEDVPVVVVNSPRGSPAQPAFIQSSKLFLTGDVNDAHPGPLFYWDGSETDPTPSPIPSTIAEARDEVSDPSSGWHEAAGTSSWTIDYTIPGTAQEGPRRVLLIAFDNAGNRNTETLYLDDNGNPTAVAACYFPYAVDTAAPQLTEFTGNDVDRTSMPASFHLNGLVGDSSGVRTITITQTLEGSSDPDYNFSFDLFNIWDDSVTPSVLKPGGVYLEGPDNGLNKPWDTGHYFNLSAVSVGLPSGFSLPLKKIGPGAYDYTHADGLSGNLTYRITATDKYGRTTYIDRRVQVDVDPPEISLLAPPANKPDGSWFDANAFIRGTASDSLSGIQQVYYWFGKGTLSGSTYTPPPLTALPDYSSLAAIEGNSEWQGASGTTSWSVPLNIAEASFDEGYYTLYVIATDGAGNIGGEKTGLGPYTYPPLAYDFRVDKANPTVTETLVDPLVDVVYDGFQAPGHQSPLRKGSFDLSLTLEDSYGVSRLVVKQTKKPDSVSPGTTLTVLNKTYPAGTPLVDEPLGNLPWNAANGSGGFSSAMAADDGIYEYEFTVYDLTESDSTPANHKTAVARRSIIVDKTPPAVTHISEPGELYQTMNSTMIIRGNATDPAPGTIRKVLYWTGVATDTSATGSGTYAVPPEVPAYVPTDPVYNPANGGYATRPWKEVDYSSSGWSKEIALGSAEGQRVVAVLTEDRHGNVSELKLYQPGPTPPPNTDNVSVRFFYKDDNPPAFRETKIATETRVSQAPQFSMGGYVQDSNSVDRIELTQNKMDSAGTVIVETKTFTLNLNKTSGGKTSMQYWKFEGLPYLDNTGDSQTSYTSGGDGTLEALPITFTGKPFAGSGEFRYVITAYDVSPRTAVQNRSVIIDTEPPLITFNPGSGGNPAAGAWLDQTTILAGTASDPATPSSGISVVYYAVTADTASHPALYTSPGVFNSAGWESATPRGGFQSWNITLPITAASGNIAEGKWKLHIIAMDGAGNIGGTALNTPVSYLFNVDKAPPEVTAKYNNLETDGFYSPPNAGGRFTLTGEFGDSYGIDSIQITQTYNGTTKSIKDYADSAAYNSSYTQGSATWPVLAAWSLGSLPRDPTASSIKAPTAAAITDGVYTYRITVRDNAGRETTAVRVVSVDSSDPVVTVTSPQVVVDQGWTGDANITITGTATDDPDGSGPIPAGVIANVYYWLAAANTTVETLSTDANGEITGGAVWAKAQLISGTDNWTTGSYTFPFPEGKLKLIVQARDAANHFSAQVVKEFWVDQADPTLTAFASALSAVNITGPTTEAFKLSGTAWDTNGIRDITVVQRKAGVTTPLEVEVVPVSGVAYTADAGTSAVTAKGWSFDGSMANLPRLQTAPGLTHSLDDGTYTYIVTLTDNSGRTAKSTLEINVDRTKPNITEPGSDITVTWPVVSIVDDPATWVRGAAVQITGKAADSMPAAYTGTITPSGIDKVIYWAGVNSAAAPAVGANLADAETNGWKTNANYNAATTDWSATLVLADLGLVDGTNKLWVRAYDRAGNLSDAYTRQFGVDQANPILTETSKGDPSPAELAYPMNDLFSLNGAVTEANMGRVIITQQARNAGGTFVDISPVQIAELTSFGGTSPDYTWALPADTLPRGYTGNGTPDAPLSALDGIALTFIYKITAVDSMGNPSSEITRYVTIDNAGPIVEITHPTPGADYQGTSIQIDGTATDFSAVTAVKYLITPASDVVGSLPVYTDAAWEPVTKLEAGTWSAFVNFAALGMTEGDLKLWVIASDGTNWGGSNVTPGQPASVAFTLDQARPEIGPISYTNTTTVSRNRYARGGFSFEFNAMDSNKLPDDKLSNPSGAVTITRGGTTLTSALGLTITTATVSGYDAVKVTVNQTVGNELPEGTHTYVITVTDKSGKTTVAETTVIVDKTDPELNINSVIPVVEEGTTEKVNGLFWFTVSSSDDNGIYPYNAAENEDGSPQGGVKYYFVPAGTGGHPIAAPFADTTAGTVLKPGPYQGVVNTASVSAAAPYTLWVYSRDRAGRVKSLSRPFTVDQATDKPVVNVPAMEGYNDTTNIFTLNPDSAGYPLVGIISDDDNVDGTKLRVWRSAVGANPDPAQDTDWIEITNSTGLTEKTQISGSDKQWRFTYLIGMPGYSLTDGTYKLRVVVEDKDKNYPNSINQLPNNPADPMGVISAPAVVEVRKVYTFNVDALSPEITVDTIEPTYKQSETIAGTVKEATLKAFRVALDGRTINAFDSNGVPLGTGELLLSGTGETKNWTLNIASAAFTDNTDPRYLVDGPHSLLWTAEDAVGNTTTLGKTFYKDSSGPDINFTNINEDQMFIVKGEDSNSASVWYNPRVMNDNTIITKNEEALKAVADVITDGTPKLTGTFSDEFSTVFASTDPGDIKFWYRFDAPGMSTTDVDAWTEATGVAYLPNFEDLKITAAKTVRWQIPLDFDTTGLSQGYHTVDIKVFDRWGSPNGLTVTASSNDIPNGGKLYQYERVAFRLDSDPPEIEVPDLTDGDKALVDGATFGTHVSGELMFTLKAEVKDVTLSSVTANIYVGNSTTARHTFTLGGIVDGAEKTLTINSPFTETHMTALLAAAAGAGETSNIYRVVISATDGAPRTTIKTLQFKMDGAPPTITTGNLITNTGSSSYPTVNIDPLPTIQGNISDDSGIGVAQYTIERWNYSTPAWEAVIDGTQNLSLTNFATEFVTMEAFTINLGSAPLNLTDGKYRISFNLKDKASPQPNQAEKINGNTDSINNIEFFIDRAAPVLETVQFKSPPFYSGTEVNISSTEYMAVYLNVSDLNTITTVRAQLESDAPGTYPLTAAAGSFVSGSNYRLLIPKTTYAEGLHTLTLEATDGAGRTTTITRDFTLDKTLPTLQIIEPTPIPPETAEITSEATIRGITVDNTSVSKLYYLFGRTEVANGTVASASFPANTTAVIDGKIWREFSAGIDKDGATIAAGSYTAPTATSNLDKAQGGGSLYNWTIRLPNSVDLTTAGPIPNNYVSLHSGSTYLCDLPIKFMMIDSAGNVNTVDYMVVVNPKGDEPTVTIASPSPAKTAAQNEVGGVVTVVGAAKDNDWIHRVVFRVIDGDEPDTGSTLPVYNAAGDGYSLDAVTNTNYAASPYNDNRGGWYQAPIVGMPGSNVQWSINLNNSGLLNAPSAGTRVVTIQVLAYDTPAANHTVAQTMGEISRVKVTFVDGLPFVVDGSVIITPDPKNGVPFGYDDAVGNKRVGGTINVKARIRDDNGLKELTWHGEDTTQYGTSILSINPGTPPQYAKPLNPVPAGSLNPSVYYMWLAGGERNNFPFLGSSPPAELDQMTWAAPALKHDGTPYTDSTLASKAYIDYELSLNLDTRTLVNKTGPLLNRAGTWTLSVLATDHTDFKMPANWTLQIDNYYPLGTYTGNGVAAGTSYQLQGLAWDTGAGVTVQGIKKVVAWFSRGPNFVPLNERDMGSGAAFKAATGAITVAHGRTDANKDNTPGGGGGNWNTGDINDGASPIKFPDLTYTRKYLADGTTPNPDYYGTNSSNAKFISGIEIDQNEPTMDNDGDGFLEGMADAGNNFQWYARIDTTKFLDGLLTVHYLVYDHAGNPSYYSNNIFISNNPPKVTSVDIGTDVLGVGSAVDPRGIRTVSANYASTNITARNNTLSFKFSVEGDTGAIPFHYRFGYVSSRVSKSATELVVGQIYAITAVGTVNWEAVGAPSGYGVGTTFMATDPASFGVGTADLLTINNIHAANINSATPHVFSHTYTTGDFGSIPDAAGNNAWFVLRVYNSLKIPMRPDFGALENGGTSQTGAGGIFVYDNSGPFDVWDQPFDVVRIGLNVANNDVVKPVVKLWDLNPGGETAGSSGAAQPPASIDLTPNTAKSPNLLKGGLYNPRNNNRNIERSGHIEPRYAASPGTGSYFIDGNYGLATFARDTLSGEVILRGFAYDEQRLGAVYLRIDSPSANGTEFKILQSDDTTSYNSANPGNRGLLVPVSGQNAFAYNQIGLEGHMVEWAYVWNTVNLPAGFVAGDNVKVQVRVEDKKPNSSVIRLHPNTGDTANGTTILNGTNDGRYPLVLRDADGWRLNHAADTGYNRIAVTLAPYVNSFQRDASKGYNSLRSRQGWYAFSRGETIVAQGWNLKYPSAATTVTFDTATATVAATVTTQIPTGITFTVPATAVSGDVKLVANSVSTVNDRNDNRNPWNKDDYNLSISGNELWIDDRAAHVWASDAGTNGTNVVQGSDRMQINGSETPTDPALTMAPRTGVLWASWAKTASAAVYMNTNQGAAGRVEIIRNSGGGGQLTTTDLYYAEPQRTYATNSTYPTVFYHSNRIYGNSYSQTASGGLKGYDPRGGGRYDSSSSGEDHQYNVELTYHNSLNTQFEGYHRVVYRGDNIHVSYYDSKDKSLKYWYVKSGWAASSTQYNNNSEITYGTPETSGGTGYFGAARHWMNLDGGQDAQDTAITTNTYLRVRPGTSATEGAWNFTRASAAGPWSAIDLRGINNSGETRGAGAPVIAYFDAEHSTLRLASANHAYDPNATGSANGASAGSWRVQYAMLPSDPNYNFAGEYVSMQIDQTNNDAHLAFFRSNSTQLVYLKLKWNGTTKTYDHTYGPSVIVDESSANGKWVDLVLDKQNRPWISYQDISRAGNFDGVKMAYYDPTTYETAGVHSYDMNGVDKTGWETMNVPAVYKASDNRTGIEVWPHRDTPSSITVTKTWAAAVGYTNPDYYRIAYYLKPRN